MSARTSVNKGVRGNLSTVVLTAGWLLVFALIYLILCNGEIDAFLSDEGSVFYLWESLDGKVLYGSVKYYYYFSKACCP